MYVGGGCLTTYYLRVFIRIYVQYKNTKNSCDVILLNLRTQPPPLPNIGLSCYVGGLCICSYIYGFFFPPVIIDGGWHK